MPKVMKKSKTSQAASTKKQQREVLYNSVTVEVHDESDPIAAEDAKQLLGWEEETEQNKFGDDYLFKDRNGVKIRCNNNYANRPFQYGLALKWASEILKGNWRLNGESIIVGETGETLSAQHRLIGLVLAVQDWQTDKERFPYWQEEPVLFSIVVYGIKEDDETVNTIDTGKARDLTDVIYRSRYLSDLSAADRTKCANIAAYAVRLVRYRTGADINAYAPGQATHAENLKFLDAHGRMLSAVKHIYEENGKEKKIDRYTKAGTAAGLMYLMGCCKSDRAAYQSAVDRTEESLDFSTWGMAADFWVLLAGNDKKLSAIKEALSALETDSENGSVSSEERWAVLINAWNAYLNGKPITQATLKLDFVTNQETLSRRLVEMPTVGGIDIGSPKEADEEAIAAADPSEEEIEAAKTKIKKAKIKKAPKRTLVPSKAGEEWDVGDVAWVFDADGEHYLIQITAEPWQNADNGEMLTEGEDANGEVWEVKFAELSLEQPANVTSKKSAVPKMKTQPTKHLKNADKKKIDIGVLVYTKHKGDLIRGRIVELEGKNCRIKIDQGSQGAGNIIPVRVADVSLTQPKPVD